MIVILPQLFCDCDQGILFNMGGDEQEKHVQVQSVELGPREISHERVEQQPTVNVPAKAWPQEPVPLIPKKHEQIALILYDVALIAIPVVLVLKIVGCIVSWSQDRKYTNNEIDSVHATTRVLVQFNDQLVTIFTIIFVTIISTLVKRYALYKAQRGAFVSDLEQLQGSVSMVSTLKLVWSLRSWSRQSIILCLIWCFYYLGSQASKREFAIADSGSLWTMPAASFNFSGSSFFDPILSDDYIPNQDPTYLNNRFLRSSIVQNHKQDPNTDLGRGSDLDGWPLVPNIALALNPDPDIISGLPGALSNPSTDTSTSENASPETPKGKTPDRHGWISVAAQSKNVYISLTGHPLYTQQRNYNYSNRHKIVGSYNYKTAYLNIGCGVPVKHQYADFPDKMANGTRLLASMNMVMNDVAVNASRDAWGHPLRTFDLWVRWPNGTIYTNNGSFAEPASVRSTCNITSTHVEVSVSCGQLGCVPIRMRYRDPSQPDSPSIFKLNNAVSAGNATSYSTPFDKKAYADNFFSNFTLSTGPATDLEGSTPIFNYVKMSVVRYYASYDVDTTSSGCVLCGESDVAMRQQVNPAMSFWFNTYAQIGQYEFALASSDAWTLAKHGSDGSFNPVVLKGAFYNRAYYIYWHWIAIDFASCLVLLVAGVLCHWLRVHTLAPDIFGYVSSLTRDNPYFDLPDNGSALSGLDRARLMKRVKVKIGDLNAEREGDVGKIGLARLDTGSRQVVGLTKQKAYL